MEMDAIAAEMALEMAVVGGNGDDGCEKLNCRSKEAWAI